MQSRQACEQARYWLLPATALVGRAPRRTMEGNNLAQQIMAIQRDPNLTDVEKAKKRQELLSGKWAQPSDTATGA